MQSFFVFRGCATGGWYKEFEACFKKNSFQGGFLVAFSDVAESYSGVVFGISNTFATLTGIFVPYFVAAITKNVIFFCRLYIVYILKKIGYFQHEQGEWRIVFLTTSGVYFVGGLITVLFGTSKLQIWLTKNNYETIQDDQAIYLLSK